MIMDTFLVLAFILGLSGLSPLYAQSSLATDEALPPVEQGSRPLRFDRLSIEDGLSQNDVFTILQDRQGFMWFGTNFGLNRYDGYAFNGTIPFFPVDCPTPRPWSWLG